MSIVSTIVRHAPKILKGAAIAGVGVTAYTAHKDAKKAYKIIDNAEFERVEKGEDPLTMIEKAQLTWKCYAPTAASVAVTGLAIFGLHRVNLNNMLAKQDILLKNVRYIQAQLATEAAKKVMEKEGIATVAGASLDKKSGEFFDFGSDEGVEGYVGMVTKAVKQYARYRTFLGPISSVIGLASSIASATFNLTNKMESLGYESIKELEPAEAFNLFALDSVSVIWSVASAFLGIRKLNTSASALMGFMNTENESHIKSTQVLEKAVKSRLGEEKLEEMRSEVKEKTSQDAPVNTVYIAGEEVLIMDEYSGRVFKNDVTTIREAVNDTNADALNNVYASLSDFWDRIGLDPTFDSDEIGWSADALLEVTFEPTILEGKRPALLMQYDARPFGRLSDVRG